MRCGYYPGWDKGFVREYLDELRKDGQRKKAAVKLIIDIQTLESLWPLAKSVTVKSMKGHEPLMELIREYQSIAYRIFFCVKGHEIWLLHAIEKKRQKTPPGDLNLAYSRMQNVLSRKVRRSIK